MDTIVPFSRLPSEEVASILATRSRSRRLALDLTQKGLADRAGVALATLRKFERTGQISLLSFIRLAVTLRDEVALGNLLLERKQDEFRTLEDALGSQRKRKQGRIT